MKFLLCLLSILVMLICSTAYAGCPCDNGRRLIVQRSILRVDVSADVAAVGAAVVVPVRPIVRAAVVRHRVPAARVVTRVRVMD